MGKETIKTEGCKLLLGVYQSVTSSDVTEFQTTDKYSNCHVTRVKYSI
jgi:hypothetical protein